MVLLGDLSVIFKSLWDLVELIFWDEGVLILIQG